MHLPKCAVVHCDNEADPRWYARDASGTLVMICDGHDPDPRPHEIEPPPARPMTAKFDPSACKRLEAFARDIDMTLSFEDRVAMATQLAAARAEVERLTRDRDGDEVVAQLHEAMRAKIVDLTAARDSTLADLRVAKAVADAALAEVATLRTFVEGVAERDCEYGDGCPPLGSRHYRCDGCKAREAIGDASGCSTTGGSSE